MTGWFVVFSNFVGILILFINSHPKTFYCVFFFVVVITAGVPPRKCQHLEQLILLSYINYARDWTQNQIWKNIQHRTKFNICRTMKIFTDYQQQNDNHRQNLESNKIKTTCQNNLYYKRNLTLSQNSDVAWLTKMYEAHVAQVYEIILKEP